MSNNEADVGHAPAEGKITPEAIKAAENMIGMQLRPEGPYLQDATEDTIRNFCNGRIEVLLCCFTLQRSKSKKPFPVVFQHELHRARAQMANAIKKHQNRLRVSHRR